jgi:hypothetical protein
MSVFARILLRYLVGYLIAKGLPEDVVHMIATDPETVAMIEVGAGAAIIEGWYGLARRFGWAR